MHASTVVPRPYVQPARPVNAVAAGRPRPRVGAVAVVPLLVGVAVCAALAVASVPPRAADDGAPAAFVSPRGRQLVATPAEAATELHRIQSGWIARACAGGGRITLTQSELKHAAAVTHLATQQPSEH